MTDFRILKVFNDERVRGYANSKTRVGRNTVPYFGGDSLAERVVRELSHARALSIKEVVEAFEFFAVVRMYLRRTPTIVDLCSGHGLAGMLFAVFERRTREVVLADKRQPKSFEQVLNACSEAAPWTLGKVRYEDGKLDGPLAVVHCCRTHAVNPAPQGLRQALGDDVAYDVERSYALERGGYRIRWREISVEITPMNRVLIAVPLEQLAGTAVD